LKHKMKLEAAAFDNAVMSSRQRKGARRKRK
jgi:hypothetical protein